MKINLSRLLANLERRGIINRPIGTTGDWGIDKPCARANQDDVYAFELEQSDENS